MIAELLPALLPAVALYPEIHYRFRLFPFSRYYRRAPEIIADAPRRLEPGRPLPLLLLIKCAHRFPLRLEGIEIEARVRDRLIRKRIAIGESLNAPYWSRIEFLDLPDEAPAVWEVEVHWQIELQGRFYRIHTDNLPGLSAAPLKVIQSGHPLPRRESWLLGDLHVHTASTEDQVEFGAPLEAYPRLGSAQGLAFAFAADHAYDLDDLPGSWIESDPHLICFRRRDAALEKLNERHRPDFTLLPGFELSAGNAENRNVHLLLVGQRDFLPGSGDSAERWLRTRPDLPVREVLSRCGDGVLPIAAHPMVKPSWLEKFLLSRGRWEQADLEDDRLSGMQVWNGDRTADFEAGVKRWVEGLLQGKRWQIVAGSDAHGNFNRYREVGFPMLKLAESGNHVFGQCWTGVRLNAGAWPEEIVRALRSGPSLVSDGPFAELEIVPSEAEAKLRVSALSSPEFGALSSVTVYQGIPGEDQERLLFLENLPGGYDWENEIPLPEAEGYVRMEAATKEGRRCLTNAINLIPYSPLKRG